MPFGSPQLDGGFRLGSRRVLDQRHVAWTVSGRNGVHGAWTVVQGQRYLVYPGDLMVEGVEWPNVQRRRRTVGHGYGEYPTVGGTVKGAAPHYRS